VRIGIGALVVVVLGVGAMACIPPASLRVGYVDGTRVVRSTARGKAIRQKIQVESKKLESKLTALQQAVRKAEQKLKVMASKRPATDPVLTKKRKALRLATTLLRSNHLRYQKELNAYGQRLLDDFKEAIRKVAMGIKRRLGLDLVIMTSRGEGLWVWPVKDITDQVMQEMDRDK
jgi:Skp family chaperone for outer membrane proteins